MLFFDLLLNLFVGTMTAQAKGKGKGVVVDLIDGA
jgi:hypothetical protein